MEALVARGGAELEDRNKVSGINLGNDESNRRIGVGERQKRIPLRRGDGTFTQTKWGKKTGAPVLIGRTRVIKSGIHRTERNGVSKGSHAENQE